MIFLLLNFFLVQALLPADNRLIQTSDRSIKLFSSMPDDVIKKIVSCTVNFDIKPVKKMLQEVKDLFHLSQISKSWSTVIDFKQEKVLEKFDISPICYACLTDSFEQFALLYLNENASFLVDPMPYSYALSCDSKTILSFFCAFYPQLISSLEPRIKESVLYFIDPIQSHHFIPNAIMNNEKVSLPDLTHYLYNLAYDRQISSIKKLSPNLLKLKENKEFARDEPLTVLFIDFFLKSFYERLFFSTTYYHFSKNGYFLSLDPKNKTFVEHYKIDVNTLFNDRGITPLIDAIRSKNINMVKLLIETYNASVNAFDCSKKPPLFYAIQGFECIVKTLLACNDIDLEWIDTENGNTFFHYLKKHSLVGSKIGMMLLSSLKNSAFLLTKNYEGQTYTQVNAILE